MRAYFEEYGLLEYLDPERYFAEPWSPFAQAEDEDGTKWQIVANNTRTELRFTDV